MYFGQGCLSLLHNHVLLYWISAVPFVSLHAVYIKLSVKLELVTCICRPHSFAMIGWAACGGVYKLAITSCDHALCWSQRIWRNASGVANTTPEVTCALHLGHLHNQEVLSPSWVAALTALGEVCILSACLIDCLLFYLMYVFLLKGGSLSVFVQVVWINKRDYAMCTFLFSVLWFIMSPASLWPSL